MGLSEEFGLTMLRRRGKGSFSRLEVTEAESADFTLLSLLG